MLHVALAQLRMHASRFVAIALAVLVAVAFLAATLMVNASTQASLKASIGQDFAKADLVVSGSTQQPLSDAAVNAVKAVPGVRDVYAERRTLALAQFASSTDSAVVTSTAPSSDLEAAVISSGVLPTQPGQVSLDSAAAARTKVKVGDHMKLSAASAASGSATSIDVVVVGLTEPSHDPRVASLAQLTAPESTVLSLQGIDSAALTNVQLKTDGPRVQEAVKTALANAGFTGSTVHTADEETTAVVQEFTGGSDQLTIILLAFAVIALVVSALVVANTFSVLIAQRTRELALLRCIGAGRGQIRRSVLLEALVLGAVASVTGVGVAVGGMAALIGALRTNPDYRFATLAVPASAVITAVVVGVVLTLVAALVPARRATAVAPLAALRPAEEPTVGNRAGVLRLIIGLLLFVVGSLALGYGAFHSQLVVALPGGALTFIGLLLCAALFVPASVAGVGRLARPFGVPGRLAAVNALRNPSRTTATASALLIGVTLVTMMMTGAQTARDAFDTQLNNRYPVDVSISGPMKDGTGLGEKQVTEAQGIRGVKAAVLIPVLGFDSVNQQPIYGITAADAEQLLPAANRPQPGTIMAPKNANSTSIALNGANLTVQQATSSEFPLLTLLPEGTDPATAAAPISATNGASSMVWLETDPGLKPGDLTQLRESLGETLNVQSYMVAGGALDKATFGQIIDTLLLVVTGLLAVAVFIALIGVANTLSLSVLERTRENSLLRALGLTRQQLRSMLALEALLVAGVAAVLGSVMGIVFGWLGAQSALGSFTTVVPSIPWWQIVLVVTVAAVAGLIASVAPARRAARLSPVAGLAME